MRNPTLSSHFSGIAEALQRLVQEQVEERLAVSREREQEIVRAMYRRGYLAGRAAQRRGAPLVTNPERRARGEAGELLRS